MYSCFDPLDITHDDVRVTECTDQRHSCLKVKSVFEDGNYSQSHKDVSLFESSIEQLYAFHFIKSQFVVVSTVFRHSLIKFDFGRPNILSVSPANSLHCDSRKITHCDNYQTFFLTTSLYSLIWYRRCALPSKMREIQIQRHLQESSTRERDDELYTADGDLLLPDRPL